MAERIVEKQKVDWDYHVEQCRLSEMNRRQYANSNNLNYDQLNYYYRKTYAGDGRSIKTAKLKEPQNDFIQVRVLDEQNKPSTEPCTIRIVTPDGLKVELGQPWAARDVVDFLRLWTDAP